MEKEYKLGNIKDTLCQRMRDAMKKSRCKIEWMGLWLMGLSGLVPACEAKGRWFNSQSGHMPVLQAKPPVGGARESTTHWCFSSSLSPSFTLSPKINTKNLLKTRVDEVLYFTESSGSPANQVPFEQNPGGRQSGSHAVVWGKCVPCCEKGRCRDSEHGICFEYPRLVF